MNHQSIFERLTATPSKEPPPGTKTKQAHVLCWQSNSGFGHGVVAVFHDDRKANNWAEKLTQQCGERSYVVVTMDME